MMFETLFGSEMPLAPRLFIFFAVVIALILVGLLLVVDLLRQRGSSKPTRPNLAMTAYAKPVSTEQLAVVEQRIANEDKSVALAYVLWFLIGTLGIHNFYIGRSGRGLVELILCFVGSISLGAGFSFPAHSDPLITLAVFGFACLFVLSLILLIDLFMIPSMIKKYRGNLRAKYIVEFVSDGPEAGNIESSDQRSWYYADRNGQVGPLSLNELQGTLTTILPAANAGEVLIWHRRFPKWKLAKDVAELNIKSSVPPPLPNSFTRNESRSYSIK